MHGETSSNYLVDFISAVPRNADLRLVHNIPYFIETFPGNDSIKSLQVLGNHIHSKGVHEWPRTAGESIHTLPGNVLK